MIDKIFSVIFKHRASTLLYFTYLDLQFKVLGNVVKNGKTDAKWQHVFLPSEVSQRAYDSMEPFKGDC